MAGDVSAYEATLVGDQLPGGNKWHGGVMVADGNIYGIPLRAMQVLCFDPRTQQATLVGEQLPGSGKWFGGVLAADGGVERRPQRPRHHVQHVVDRVRRVAVTIVVVPAAGALGGDAELRPRGPAGCRQQQRLAHRQPGHGRG